MKRTQVQSTANPNTSAPAPAMASMTRGFSNRSATSAASQRPTCDAAQAHAVPRPGERAERPKQNDVDRHEHGRAPQPDGRRTRDPLRRARAREEPRQEGRGHRAREDDNGFEQ